MQHAYLRRLPCSNQGDGTEGQMMPRRVRLLTDIFPIYGGRQYAGSEYTVVREYETNDGTRYALSNGERVVCEAVAGGLLEPVED